MTPYDAEGLWLKAKAHLNRSFAAKDRGSFEEAALWAASALELLAKSALARINPLLIADPQDDGRSLMIAAGLSDDFARFKSVPAKGLFSRCSRAFRQFNGSDAASIATHRNEELHSALTPFNAIDEELWWQRYWAQAVILVHATDAALSDLVGIDRERVVEAYVAQNAENTARRVQAMIERARRRWEQAEDSADAREEIRAIVARGGFDGEFSEMHRCPVCNELGEVFGDFVTFSDVEYDGDDGSMTEILEVGSESFECDECGLRLNSEDFLLAAGIAETFRTERPYEPEWDDYGND